MTFLYCTALNKSELTEISRTKILSKFYLSSRQLKAQRISDLETEFNITKSYIKNLPLKSNCLFLDYCNDFYYLFNRKLEILNSLQPNNPACEVIYRKLTIELNKFHHFIRQFNQYK
jgi:hypothetical protein